MHQNLKIFLALICLSGILHGCVVTAQVLPSVEKIIKTAEKSKKNNPVEAYRLARQALVMAEKNNHLPSIAMVQRYLGVICFMTGKPREARLHFDTAFMLYTRLKDEKGIGYCLNNFGVIYQETGEYDKAINCFERSVSIKLKLGDTAGAAGGMLNTGTIYSYRGENAKAINTFRMVMRIAIKARDTARLIDAGINLATVFINEKRSDSAFLHLRKIYVLSEKTGDDYSLAYCLNNIGEVFRSVSRNEEALSYFNRALVIRGDIGDVAGMASTLNNLGGIYEHLRKTGKAIDCYFQSLKYSQQLSDKRSIAIAMNSIGELLMKQGDATGASAYLRSAAEIASRLEMKSETKEIYANLILSYGASRRFDSARACLELYSKVILEAASYPDEGPEKKLIANHKTSRLKNPGWNAPSILLVMASFFIMVFVFTLQKNSMKF